MRRRNLAAVAAAVALAALSLGACSTHAQDTVVNVYAAASLTDVFTSLADQYEKAHDGVDVRLTFAGSSDLASQINEGAPADVFASANEKQMTAVEKLVDGKSEIFATNTLTIVVPTGNPAGVTDFASLATPSLRLVICEPEVPCGAATATIATQLGVTLTPVSEAGSVTDVLGSVSSGEADAGVVYRTDVARADRIQEIPFDESDLAVNRYPIAVMTTGKAAGESKDFMAFVLGKDGQDALQSAGFGAP